ncbi:hypothetical protein [Streptomyces sp. NPDC002692]
MSRELQQRLLSRIELAVQFLDLPLTRDHIERLTTELTPAIRAILLGEQAAETEPVAYTVVAGVAEHTTREYPACVATLTASTSTVDTVAGVETTEYAGCTARVGLDVDLDSPAARVAEWMRRQPEVVATDVPAAMYVGATLRPQSLTEWAWWLHKLGVTSDDVTIQGTAAYISGQRDGVTVQVQAEGVPGLLADRPAARLAGVIGGHPW